MLCLDEYAAASVRIFQFATVLVVLVAKAGLLFKKRIVTPPKKSIVITFML